MTRSTCFTTACLLIVGLTSLCAHGQGEFPLERHPLADGPRGLVQASRRPTMKSAEKPSQLKGVPEALSEKAAYFVVRAGSGGFLLAIDLSGSPVLYVDTDRDNDLADEKPIALSEAEKWAYYSGVITVGASKGKDQPAVQFELWAYAKGRTVPWISVAPAGFYSGKVTIGEKAYAVALTDLNLDGRLLGRQDTLALDLNGSGDFEPLASEIMPLSDMVRVENAYYSVEAEADGSAIRLKKITPESGTLAVEDPCVQFTVLGHVGMFSLEASDSSWKLPVGKYTTALVKLAVKDEEENVWILPCVRLPSEMRELDIRKGETVALAIGPPLTLATDVSPRGGSVLIGVNLTGRAGERYLPGAFKNGEMLEPPKFRILDEAGHELAADSFQYG